MAILDSGDRTQFETGAVRDMHEGKGRMDLVPLDEVGYIIGNPILYLIDGYVRNGDINYLTNAFLKFSEKNYPDIYTAILEMSIHYEEGSRKYQARNWEKGIPLHAYIDSACRHYIKFLRGDTDERHDRAFMWNILCAMWTHNNLPEMNDLPWKENDT